MERPHTRFYTADDGTRIAWSMHGSGYPLVRVSTAMTHLVHDWDTHVWRHWLEDLGARFTSIRYDERGCGMSSRRPSDISLEAWLGDLHGVIEATGFDRVALLGMSHAAALAIAYADRHPDRVSHIVSLGGFAAGGMASGSPPEAMARSRAFHEATRALWEAPDKFFRRVWTLSLVPGARDEDVAAIEELMRVSSTGEIAARIFEARDRVDVREVAPKVATPTLVAHARSDHAVSFKHGVELAGLLPNASLLALDTENHMLLPEPAWDTFVSEVVRFIGVVPVSVSSQVSPSLSARELEVLALVAQGLSNDAIGENMALSTRTVERHLSNLYRKLGLSGRSARAAAAARFQDL